MYNSKYFPRIFYVKSDGGKDSGVKAYFLIEWKVLFSIGILHFKKGTREAFHNHAFNALTWWLKGSVTEILINGTEKEFKASIIPKYTSRDCFHKVKAHEDTYALTFRSHWNDTWKEFKDSVYKMYLNNDIETLEKYYSLYFEKIN